jgi:hypothetical protein
MKMADNDKGIPPVSLAAGSYDIEKLQAAISGAHEVTGDDHAAALDKAVRDTEELGVAVPASEIAIPEGHVLAEVEDAQGRTVTAAVSAPVESDDTTKS